jgi:hypothetical protein
VPTKVRVTKGASDYAPGQVKADGDSARDEAPGHKKPQTTESEGSKPHLKNVETNGKDDPSKSKRKADSRSGAGGGGKAKIGAIPQEKKTEVRAAFRKHHAKPAHDLDISISIGAVVPRSVTFHPIPRNIIVIAPAYEGYLYFVVGDQLCIVDPVSYEIVDIIYV